MSKFALPKIVQVAALCVLLTACAGRSATSTNDEPTTVRLAYFPNITHAAALVGMADGSFQRAVGPRAALEARTFNSGPQLIEALLAGEVDIGYVGPSPAINAWVRTKGRALVVVAGAASGGARFVVRAGSGIHGPQDLATQKIAAPQKGGTQDVALRSYLAANGLSASDSGGTVDVVNAENAAILMFLRRGDVDAAWMPEPWAERLIRETGAHPLLDERELWPNSQFSSALVIMRRAFYEQQPQLARAFLAAHVDAVNYVREHPTESRAIITSEIQRLSSARLPDALIKSAMQQLEATWDPLAPTLAVQAERAQVLGYFGSQPISFDGFIKVDLLNEALAARKLPVIRPTSQGGT